MSSFADAFGKYGFYRDNTQITAVKGIGRNWQHVYILRFGDALNFPYERLVRCECHAYKTYLYIIRGKALFV